MLTRPRPSASRQRETKPVESTRIAIAGFSQGGAMALHIATRAAQKFAGVIALSCYLPLSRELAEKRNPANDATPFFMAHGTQDPVVQFSMGDESRQLLAAAGYAVRCTTPTLGHGLCQPKLRTPRLPQTHRLTQLELARQMSRAATLMTCCTEAAIDSARPCAARGHAFLVLIFRRTP